MHLIKSMQTLLFPWERISRKRFFWAILAFTAATYFVALLPASPSLFGMEFLPPVEDAVLTFMVVSGLFFRLCSSFYTWWRIYDATLSKGTTWFYWLIGTVIWWSLGPWAVIVPFYLVFILFPSKEGNEQ